MIDKILIVDDSAIARSIIRRSLEIIGFRDIAILEANNGNEALVLLKSQEVSIVFTDINMPEMDGIQLLKRIKSSPKLNHISVVVITSRANPVMNNQLLTEHALAVFTKPVSLQSLRELMESFQSA